MTDFVAELEERARGRFVRWDAGVWREVLDGPARRLAASLEEARLPDPHARSALESYLRLAAEGIGLGYLFATAPEADSFFGLAWRRLIPEGLAALPPARQAQALAECWNLGENLESSPVWLRRIFLRLCSAGVDLGRLEALVADVGRRALEPPPRRLDGDFALQWLHMGEEDRRFLPGWLHFLAPTVVCVHDRQRTAAGGREAVTLGAWLAEPPLQLGAMGCRQDPTPPGAAAQEAELELLERASRLDPRAGDWLEAARNDWRAALTLETSQFLVALVPA